METEYKNGWICLHRKMLLNPICKKPYYAWLWCYLLLICNHEPHDFIWNNKRMTVRRGQVITGRINLSENTGISQTTVERILDYFEKDGQIGQQKTNKFRLITVKNYSQHQDKRTTSGQQADNKRTQINNDNNYNNILQADACEEWNSDEYIKRLLNDNKKHIAIIGKYFKQRGVSFPSKLAAEKELKRWLRPARELAEHEQQKIVNSFNYVSNKFPEEWNLSTMAKYINNPIINQ